MQKLLAFFLITVLLAPCIAHAREEQDEPVIIPYSHAVELVHGTLQDMEEIFEDMRELQDELRDEIRTLERGDAARETIDALLEELDILEWQLFSATMTHEMMHGGIESSIENIIAGMANPDEIAHVNAALQAAIAGIMAVQGMGGNMAMMQTRINEIFTEITRLQDGENMRDVINGLKDAIGEIDYQMDVLALGHRQSALAVENGLRSLIIAVAELETALQTMEATFAQTEENLRRVTIRYNFGLASSNQVRTAAQAVTLGQLALTQRQTSLHNARNSLNYLLGQPLSQRTVVAFDLKTPEIPEDLDAHIRQVIPTAPPIIRLQMVVDTAHEALQAYKGFDRDTRTPLQEAHDRAVQNRDSAMRTMEAAMRRAYNDLANLQTQKESQLLEVHRAELALEAAKTNFTLGRITRHDVTQAEVAVFLAEQAITSTLNQKWLLAFRLENPSLLS